MLIYGDVTMYKNMNTVPIGTKMKIKKTGKIGELIEIFHYPTTFKVQYIDGGFDIFNTHEIEFLEEE